MTRMIERALVSPAQKCPTTATGLGIRQQRNFTVHVVRETSNGSKPKPPPSALLLWPEDRAEQERLRILSAPQ